mmetsp:Transcript_89374/g.157726  ORF Transcript_89374/g.157726 Transcript_89374/m.157726 type:complete len:276 (-) Transcript_89374:48-875(-)
MKTRQVTPVCFPSEFDAVVTNLAGTELCRHKVCAATQVVDLKAELEEKCGLSLTSQRLVACTTVLANEELLGDVCSGESILDLNLVMLPEEVTLCLKRLESTPKFRIANVFRDLDVSIRDCFECTLCAVKRDGRVLEFASKEMQADRRIVLTAVSENGRCFQFASESLKSDREVAMAALRSSGLALQHAPRQFRQERSMVYLALRQNLAAVEFVEETLQRKISFRLFYLYLWLSSWNMSSKLLILCALLVFIIAISGVIVLLCFSTIWISTSGLR